MGVKLQKMISSTELKNYTFGLYEAFSKGIAGRVKPFIETATEDIKEVTHIRKNIKSMGMAGAAAFSLDKIVEVVIALIVMGTILPLGIKEFMAAGNSGVLASGTIHAVWVIAPVLIVLGLVLGLIYMALGKNQG